MAGPGDCVEAVVQPGARPDFLVAVPVDGAAGLLRAVAPVKKTVLADPDRAGVAHCGSFRPDVGLAGGFDAGTALSGRAVALAGRPLGPRRPAISPNLRD